MGTLKRIANSKGLKALLQSDALKGKITELQRELVELQRLHNLVLYSQKSEFEVLNQPYTQLVYGITLNGEPEYVGLDFKAALEKFNEMRDKLIKIHGYSLKDITKKGYHEAYALRGIKLEFKHAHFLNGEYKEGKWLLYQNERIIGEYPTEDAGLMAFNTAQSELDRQQREMEERIGILQKPLFTEQTPNQQLQTIRTELLRLYTRKFHKGRPSESQKLQIKILEASLSKILSPEEYNKERQQIRGLARAKVKAMKNKK